MVCQAFPGGKRLANHGGDEERKPWGNTAKKLGRGVIIIRNIRAMTGAPPPPFDPRVANAPAFLVPCQLMRVRS